MERVLSWLQRRKQITLNRISNYKTMKQYKYRINGRTYDVAINQIDGKNANVTVNGISLNVEMEGEGGEGIPPVSGVSPATESVTPAAPVRASSAPQATGEAQATVMASGKGMPLKAPLPGVIISVEAAVGDAVKKGQTVVVLEAMKMQNNISAECDGTVTSVAVSKGDSVMEGAVLLTIG